MRRRDFLKNVGCGAAVAAGCGAASQTGALSAAAAKSAPPNFIIIFTDDQGYQDLGCFGSPNVKTPNIDGMAKEGMRFTDFYVGAPVCTPSRAALLTGCYPDRVGNLPVLFPRDKRGLNSDETTIADMLKAKGYATACIGKWHLGHLPQFLPTSQGFDSYYGIPYSNDMGIDPTAKLSADIVYRDGMNEEKLRASKGRGGGPPLMRNKEVIEWPADQALLTQRYTAEAIKFITANQRKPFFLYLPHTMPHVPLYASPEFEGKSEAGLYGDTLQEIDWSVGEILKTLKARGLDENTFVVYTSDNGPWHFPGAEEHKKKGDTNRRVGGSALPLRGAKFSTWDGGMREPTVMRWPGRIPAGKVCGELAASIDILPTFAELAGAKLPERVIDGKSIVPLIEGRPGAKTPHETYFYRTQCVRAGKWKLVKGKKAGQDQLFDLENDIAESKNVAKENPEVVERLNELLQAHKDDMKQNGRPAGKLAEAK